MHWGFHLVLLGVSRGERKKKKEKKGKGRDYGHFCCSLTFNMQITHKMIFLLNKYTVQTIIYFIHQCYLSLQYNFCHCPHLNIHCTVHTSCKVQYMFLDSLKYHCYLDRFLSSSVDISVQLLIYVFRSLVSVCFDHQSG